MQLQQTGSLAAQANIPFQLDALPNVDLPHPRRWQALLRKRLTNFDTWMRAVKPLRNTEFHMSVVLGTGFNGEKDVRAPCWTTLNLLRA
jgi:hypothetical protein